MRKRATEFAVAAAACDLKLKRLTVTQAQALADTPDENGARRLYLLMELARNRNDLDEQTQIVSRMQTDFPQSPWLAEALFSSGNMYMLRKDYPRAVDYYSYLAAHFPGVQEFVAGALAGGMAERIGRGSTTMPRGCSTTRFGTIPGHPKRFQRSIGAGGSTKRRSTSLRRQRPTIARSCVFISISSMHRWHVSGWPRWAAR